MSKSPGNLSATLILITKQKALWLHSTASGRRAVQTPPLRAELLPQRPLWNTGLHPHFL